MTGLVYDEYKKNFDELIESAKTIKDKHEVLDEMFRSYERDVYFIPYLGNMYRIKLQMSNCVLSKETYDRIKKALEDFSASGKTLTKEYVDRYISILHEKNLALKNLYKNFSM